MPWTAPLRNVVLGGVLWASTSAPAQPAGLHLVCRGIGDHQVARTSNAFAIGSDGSYASGFATTTGRAQFEDEMDVEIAGDGARARVPRRFLPPAHGGHGGWFEVKDLAVTDDRITGTVLINWAQHPKLSIDRRTGSVSMDGKVGSFSGQCQAYDPTRSARAF